jgi:hypothetical protein
MKRLKSRIDALESAAPQTDQLSASAKKMLVEVLARRDALFWPWRWNLQIQPPICELRIRQREYLSGAVGVQAKAAGARDWKVASATRAELMDAAMLVGIGGAGQVSSVILTATGEATARALIGDRLSDGQLGALMMLLHDGGPVREQFLLNHPCVGDPSDWDHLAEPLLPLLVQGVVSATSDTCGRLIYCLTDVEPIDAVQVGVAEESWADDLYIRTYRNERSHLAAIEPRDPAECFIPIGACDCWPPDFKGSDTDE